MKSDFISYHTIENLWARVHNLTRRVTLKVVDDSGGYQTHQTEGYPDELRDDVPRVQEFGRSSVPLPGSEGIVVANNGGWLGTQAITATHDPRYRPKNQKPGEQTLYIVDGAKSDGTGGTMRNVLQGALKWVTSLTGKTVNLGDNKEAVTITIGVNPDSVTINMGSSSKATVNINGAMGDCKIAGISLVNHVHSGVTPGSGNTGKPVGS